MPIPLLIAGAVIVAGVAAHSKPVMSMKKRRILQVMQILFIVAKSGEPKKLKRMSCMSLRSRPAKTNDFTVPHEVVFGNLWQT